MRTQRRVFFVVFLLLAILTPCATGQIISSGQIATSPPPNIAIQRLPVVSSVAIAPSNVAYGQSAVGTVVLTMVPTMDIDVSLKSSDVGIATVPATVRVPAGQSSATFYVKTGLVALGAVTITADTGVYPKSAQLNVGPPPVDKIVFRLATSWSEGQPLITGEVALFNAVSGVPISIPLSVDNPSLVSVPASLSFPPGATIARFPIDLQPIASNTGVMITAGSGQGAKSASLPLSAGPAIQALTLYPLTLPDGLSPNRELIGITLAQTPTYPFVLAVTSDHPESVPAQKVYCPMMNMADGSAQVNAYLTTKRVNADTPVMLTVGSALRAKSAAFTIKGPVLTDLVLAGQTSGTNVTAVGGSSPLGVSVKVSPPAGPGGLTFAISSSNAALTVPGGVITVPENATSAYVSIQTPSVGSALAVTFTATLKDVSKSATATLMPPAIK